MRPHAGLPRFTDVVKCGEPCGEVRRDEGEKGEKEDEGSKQYGAGARNNQFPA